MAHFYAHIKGQRGQASRLGTKSSGISSTTASWQGAVQVNVYHDPLTKTDKVRISFIPWRGEGMVRELYNGPIDGRG